TDSFRGVAVTANNSDNVGGFGISFGFSGTAAVNLAGVVNVENIHTSAHIGDSAKVNCGVDCTTNVSSPNGAQSVRVAAANQYYELEVAASLAIAGTAGVAVPVTVRVVNIDTYAYIGNGAAVNAEKDISVTANGRDTVVGVTAGAGGGTVGVAGTVAVTVANVHTYACTGTPTSPAYKCQTGGATLNADNNVLVSATDDSKFVLITVAIGAGYVGVGLAVGVAVLHKETAAFLGAGSVVNAKALGGAALTTVPDGTFNGGTQKYGTHGSFSGLAVEGASSEDVFGLAPAIGAGFVGVAGGVGVTLMDVTTTAFIGPDSQVNTAGGAGGSQSVNVSAVAYSKTLTIAGGAAFGFVGVAGGVDVGVADTSAQAYIGMGSNVHAAQDVEVNGLSRKEVQTYAVSVGGGFVGVGASVSVWSVGTETNSNYQNADGPDKGTWSSGADYHTGDVVVDSFDSKRYVARCDITPNVDWDNSTDYNKCRVVHDPGDGNLYQALVDNPSHASQPHSNLAQWSLYTSPAPHGDPTSWEPPTDALHTTKGDRQDASGSIAGADMAASGNSDNGGGSPPAWAPGPYSAGSYVSFDGHVWKAKQDVQAGNQALNPEQNSQPGTSHDDWAQEVDGYKGVFNGTTSSAPAPAWVSGTAYEKGDKVSFGGSTYTARVDITHLTTDPKTNTEEWWNADSQDKTSSRIAAALAGPQASVNGAAASVGGSAATSAIAHVPGAGTTATIDSSSLHATTVVAGGHVNVIANDVLTVFGVTGAVAAGAVGVGGSVQILNIESNTDAGIAPYATISGGGGVTVSASMDE